MGKSSNPTFAGDKEFEKIHLKEKFSYGLGDVACNVVFALTTSLLIYFYTNVVGISAAMIGTIMLISRFFDGISDVLIGHLVDRTHSKYGKSRAWILWMMIPYGIAAILLFTVPPATQIVKGIYVFITYNFCTTVVYTALNPVRNAGNPDDPRHRPARRCQPVPYRYVCPRQHGHLRSNLPAGYPSG